MSSQPLTHEAILDIINKAMAAGVQKDYHAKNLVIRGCKLPGKTDYSSEEFLVGSIVDRPNAETFLDDVHRVKADLEVLISEFKAAHPARPVVTPPPSPAPSNDSSLEGILGKELYELVESRAMGDVLVVKPKTWLGDDLWRSLHDKIYGAGGKWVSAGKDSHWELSLRGAKT
jgi:hypothetical protein